MNPCDDLEVDLAAHASGEPASAPLAHHLRDCSACGAELASLRAVLQSAAVPAPSELELRALAADRPKVRAAWTRHARNQRWMARSALGLCAAAAAVLLALGLHARPAVPLLDPADDLAIESLADGPIELAEEETDPATFDPELSPTVFSEEGDE